jgi:uncharacterized protein (TIGR03437 family)
VFRFLARFVAVIVFAVPGLRVLRAQAPPAIVTVDVDKVVIYEGDVPDVTRLATAAVQTAGTPANNFYTVVWVGDIVAVNSMPARGTWTVKGHSLSLSRTPTPGTGIADSGAALFFDWIFDIQQADGTPIGTIMASGWGGAAKPPGAPSSILQANMAVTGGTGAFLGVRGQAGQGGNTVFPRQASMAEDPSLRRVLGGGTRRYVFHLLPSFRPEVVMTSTGAPAVVHSVDFSPVTSASPARAGEFLSIFASGLGPTRPGVDPGQPFPASPLQPVNSPVGVSLNGNTAEVLYAGGYPGAVDRYQVNFRVPDDMAPGIATLRLSSGYIPGSEVTVAIR